MSGMYTHFYPDHCLHSKPGGIFDVLVFAGIAETRFIKPDPCSSRVRFQTFCCSLQKIFNLAGDSSGISLSQKCQSTCHVRVAILVPKSANVIVKTCRALKQKIVPSAAQILTQELIHQAINIYSTPDDGPFDENAAIGPRTGLLFRYPALASWLLR